MEQEGGDGEGGEEEEEDRILCPKVFFPLSYARTVGKASDLLIPRSYSLKFVRLQLFRERTEREKESVRNCGREFRLVSRLISNKTATGLVYTDVYAV